MEMYLSPSPFGGTKEAEYSRSAQYFDELCRTHNPYYALAMLLDSQYQREDLLNILAKMEDLKLHKKEPM